MRKDAKASSACTWPQCQHLVGEDQEAARAAGWATWVNMSRCYRNLDTGEVWAPPDAPRAWMCPEHDVLVERVGWPHPDR